MKTDSDSRSPDPVRDAFRGLSEKLRATFFKKTAHTCLQTMRSVLRAAHIPPTFQLERMDHWLRNEHQQKMEAIVLASEHEDWFEALLRSFFCHAHKALNDWLLESCTAAN